MEKRVNPLLDWENAVDPDFSIRPAAQAVNRASVGVVELSLADSHLIVPRPDTKVKIARKFRKVGANQVGYFQAATPSPLMT